MIIAVSILSVLSLSPLAVQGKPYQIINGPDAYESNNYIGRSNLTYNIVSNDDERMHYRPHHARHSSVFPRSYTTIKFNTTPITVEAGSSVEVTCVIRGSPSKMYWLDEDNDLKKQMKELDHQSNVETSTGFTLSSTVIKYVIDCATSQHNKAIRCVSEIGKTIEMSEELQILVTGNKSTSCENRLSKPTITKFANSTLSVQGQMAVLPCVAVGNPKPFIYWVDVESNRRIDDNYSDKNVRVHSDGSLIFNDLNWEEMGSYKCVAENYVGSDEIESFIYPAMPEEPSSFT